MRLLIFVFVAIFLGYIGSLVELDVAGVTLGGFIVIFYQLNKLIDLVEKSNSKK